jgi:choline-sulfatase
VIVVVSSILLWKARSGSHPLRPNIVLIIIDALRPDKLGCYGFDRNTSPEIDQMAAQGILFQDVISQCSWTRPSIGSMLTSQHPRSIGLFAEKWDVLRDKYLTLPEVLKRAGYTNLGITANPNINSAFNFHQGFDEYIDSAFVPHWMEDTSDKAAASSSLESLITSDEVFDVALKKAETFQKFPVYIQALVMEVHTPALVRDEFEESFGETEHADYLGAIRQVSYDIGQFAERLLRIPGWENTLFVLCSDHGEGLNDHRYVPRSSNHGFVLYESNVRVPLIFYHPQNARETFRGRTINRRVRLLELMPTILDYVDIPIPEDAVGKSMLGLIDETSKSIDLPEGFITETYLEDCEKIAVYTKRWKYIENRDEWPNVNPRELQPMGVTENGRLTDQINYTRPMAQELRSYLRTWERQHKREDRLSLPVEKLGDKEIQQLKSMGYIR